MKYALSVTFSIILIIYTSFSQKLSFIDTTISDAVITSSVSGKSQQFIWLQQVIEQPKTTNLKVFIRSIFIDFTSSTPQQSRLQDSQRNLQIKAWQQQRLKCGLFYRKNNGTYFIYKFAQGYSSSQTIQLASYMTQQQNITNPTFRISRLCDGILINNKRIYFYNQHASYYQDIKGQTLINYYQWDIAGSFHQSNITGIDSDFNFIIVDNGDIYMLDYQDFVQQNSGSGNIWFYYRSQYSAWYYTFATSIQIQGYQLQLQYNYCLDKIYHILDMLCQKRLIIYGYKQNGKIFNYTITAIVSDIKTGTSVILSAQGQSFDYPIFTYSPQLTKVIVYGNDTLGKPFYDGYYVNYTSSHTAKIQLPNSITKQNNFIAINQFFLYAKSISPYLNKYNESTYIFVREYLYSYFEQKVISANQYNNNWLYSILKIPQDNQVIKFLHSQMTVYHLHEFANRMYFRVQSIDSFYATQVNQYKRFVQMQLSQNDFTSSEISILSSTNNLKWIFTIINPAFQDEKPSTNITYLAFNQQTLQKRAIYYQILNSQIYLYHNYQISLNLDCFYLPDKINKKMDFYTINDQQILFVASIHTNKPFSRIPPSADDIKLGTFCQTIYIYGDLYFLNEQQNYTLFYETKQFNQLNISKAYFDQDFIFAIQDSDVYKYNGQVYEKIISSIFKNISQITISQDRNKIMVFTYELVNEIKNDPVTNQSNINVYYKFDIKTFYNSPIKGWIQIIPQTKLTQIRINKFISTKQISSNLQKMFICYIINTTYINKTCLLTIVNYTQLKSYQSIYQFDNKRSIQLTNIGSNYIFIVDSYQFTINYQTIQSDCKENILSVENNSILFQINYGVDCKLYQNDFVQRLVIQNITTQQFYFLNLYQSYFDIKIMNTTPKTINTIKQQLNYKISNRGFFYHNQSFYQCSPGCLRCENSFYCTKCIDGYTLSLQTYKCLKCQGQCSYCNQYNTTWCQTCFRGYYYDQIAMICLICHENCQSCYGHSELSCTSCKIGYFLNQNVQKRRKKTCLSCPTNCDYCSNSTNCTTCQYGYSLTANYSCVKCPLDCSVCKSDDLITCLSCRIGFQLVNQNNKTQCQVCPFRCETCVKGKCNRCRSGYELNQEKNVCYQTCWTPCRTCDFTNPSKCTSCLTGYKFNGTFCEPDISCSKLQSCVNCPSSYTLIQKRCHKCALLLGCGQCHSFDPTVCASCLNGFYFQKGQCLNCSIDKCARCYTPQICQQCKLGYMLSQINSTQSLCIQCDVNCKTCIESVTNCDSCPDTFKLVGTSCLSNKNVSFSIKLDLEIQKFTNDVYYKFISDLIKITNKSQTQIHINAFKNGSTTIQGSLDMINQTDESSTLSALNLAIVAGSEIAGQQVLSSQITGYTPIVAAQESRPNLVLILSTAIPGALIVIGLTVFITYRKFFAPKQEQPNDYSDRSTETDFSQKQRKKQEGKKPQISRKNLFGKSGLRRSTVKQIIPASTQQMIAAQTQQMIARSSQLMIPASNQQMIQGI